MEKQEDQLRLLHLQVTDGDILHYGNGSSGDGEDLDLLCRWNL